MIVDKGFLLIPVEDEKTEEVSMKAYFPYVLNSSIICSDPIMIDKYLKLTSERWTLVDGVDSVDMTSYVFECNYGNLKSDDTGEKLGSSYLSATVQYNLYRNGYMEVEGNIRLNGELLEFGYDKRLYLKKFYLPYAIPDKADVETSFLYGNVEGVTLVSSLESEKISNTNLNPSDSKLEYYHRLDITEIVPKEGGDTVPLDLVYRSLDDRFAIYSYPEYVGSYIPIKFKISPVPYM